MDGINLIQDLAIVLLAAGIAGVACRRLGLSVVVGYLLAGMLVGPFTPPFSLVIDVDRIQTLSQIGLVFLMFGIGLGLSLSKLRQMGLTTLVATGLGAFFVLNLTQLLGVAIGWTSDQALFMAAMFMVSSSAVIAKVIGELKLAHERSAQLALAITLLEDVVAVVMLTVLASRSGKEAADVGGLITGMTAFVVLLVAVCLVMVPRLLQRLESRADPELQTIVVAGVLFLLSLAAAKAGYSIALGAFLLGAIVAEIPQRTGVEKAFAGMRDLFSSVFFVSIGMMIDVRLMWNVWPWVLGLTVFVLVGRALATGLAMILCGTRPQEARRAGLLLGPLGEFSFIIVQLGVSSRVLPPDYYPLAVGVSILTVLIVPIVNRFADPLLDVVTRLEPAWLRRAMGAYHDWLHQLQTARTAPLMWRLIRSRLGQAALEMLLVSGILTFSDRLLGLLLPYGERWGLGAETLGYVFWSVIAIVTLFPLVAIWRNVTVITMIVAEGVGDGARMPRPLVLNALRGIAAVSLGWWLYVILPTAHLGLWSWAIIGVTAIVFVAVFSNRLIYWHSHWQSSMQDILASNGLGVPSGRAPGLKQQDLEDWNLHLTECVVPDGATYGGQTLAQLAIPSRCGCAVLEIERNGHVITSVGPELRLYPGDKLLLLGQTDQLQAAGEFLSEERAAINQADEFRGSVLETFTLAPGPHAGRTLAELKIAQHTGTRVVGIERANQKILAPSGQERLEAGDNILVTGTLAELDAFRRWLNAV